MDSNEAGRRTLLSYAGNPWLFQWPFAMASYDGLAMDENDVSFSLKPF